MQALLSFDQAPPLGAPLRFFLTAPVFGLLAGLLMLWSGPDLFVSRWTPDALALTHLITVGFMMQVMFGAMLQILPVVAGANIKRVSALATLVHVLLSLGVLLLVAAFVGFSPLLFKLAALVLGIAVVMFIAAAGHALQGVPSTSVTITGLKLALVGLAGVVSLGLLLTVSLGWSFNMPLMQLAELHLGWGFVGWGLVLLAAVSFVVVPMFQLTPPYKEGFARLLPSVALGGTALWTLFDLAGWPALATLLAWSLPAVVIAFAATTLIIQRHSKRPRFDVTMQYWRLAMISALAACLLWFAGRLIPDFADWPGWSLLIGVLVLFGAFMSVMIGMLYKIVPFLIWLHLQNQGQNRVMAPNMKKFISETAMSRQLIAHAVACALLILAVFQADWLARPAGLALLIDCGWLMLNLLSAVRAYRAHQAHIRVVLAGA